MIEHFKTSFTDKNKNNAMNLWLGLSLMAFAINSMLFGHKVANITVLVGHGIFIWFFIQHAYHNSLEIAWNEQAYKKAKIGYLINGILFIWVWMIFGTTIGKYYFNISQPIVLMIYMKQTINRLNH